MTHIKEVIKKWIDDWNYCDICEYAYYKKKCECKKGGNYA